MVMVRHAKEAAREWVAEEAASIPGFDGAFFHGSVNWLVEDTELSVSSDLDVMVVLNSADPREKPGKFVYRDVLFEISYLPSDQVQSANQILGRYNLAGSFHNASVIADPSGRLTVIQKSVTKQYANREWVRRRCENARDNVLRNLRSIKESDPFHEQVTGWLFGTGVTTHVLLVAGLKNPTVRKRYLAVRELLDEFDRIDFYETLLEHLGCAQMSNGEAKRHLQAVADAFDAAKTVVRTPFFFASDISDLARPISIDGSQELIDSGFHREAVFWLVATYARCQNILHHDASVAMREHFDPGFRALVADLGIESFADLQRRSTETEAFLPKVWEVAEAIMGESH